MPSHRPEGQLTVDLVEDPMAARRVFVDRVEDGRAVVSSARAHHLARVVRLREGEEVEISDGTTAWKAVAESVSPQSVTLATSEELPPRQPAARLELHVALIKFPRLEWAIEKSTELGVAAIVPIIAERSERGLVKAAEKRVERWRRIAEEAAQQSRRLGPPEVLAPLTLAESLERTADLRLFLDFDGKPLNAELLRPVPATGTVAIAIGPEGGWTAGEIAESAESGAVAVVLGDNVLRSETAAITTVGIVDQLLRTIE